MRAYKALADADELIWLWYSVALIFTGVLFGFQVRFTSDTNPVPHTDIISWIISFSLCALLLYPVAAGIKGLAAIAQRVDANAEHIGALEPLPVDQA